MFYLVPDIFVVIWQWVYGLERVVCQWVHRLGEFTEGIGWASERIGSYDFSKKYCFWQVQLSRKLSRLTHFLLVFHSVALAILQRLYTLIWTLLSGLFYWDSSPYHKKIECRAFYTEIKTFERELVRYGHLKLPNSSFPLSLSLNKWQLTLNSVSAIRSSACFSL